MAIPARTERDVAVEADVTDREEQRTPAGGDVDDEHPGLQARSFEVPEADALEQAREVTVDEAEEWR